MRVKEKELRFIARVTEFGVEEFNKLEREGATPRLEFVTDPGEMARCVA